jgi:catechol 2,3-dioxygenase-like lactoylglutathione lyase family enzyme
MIDARAINHVALRVADTKRMHDFYTNVLGLRLVQRDRQRQQRRSTVSADSLPPPAWLGGAKTNTHKRIIFVVVAVRCVTDQGERSHG